MDLIENGRIYRRNDLEAFPAKSSGQPVTIADWSLPNLSLCMSLIDMAE
jgi:hypothetical protein